MADIKCKKCNNYIDEKNKDNCPGCGAKNKITIKNEKPKNVQAVKVIDFDMEFGSMVIFIIKWTIASIPAMIILFIIGMVFLMLVGGSVTSLISI